MREKVPPVVPFDRRVEQVARRQLFFFQAEDGIRAGHVTGVQTCALPISPEGHVNVTALVDFRNDVVNTSLGVAHALGQRLWGVRVDTNESLVDLSIVREMQEKEGVAGSSDVRGVTPRLIQLLRAALDEAGYRHVRIVASGGFDAEKIRRFEALGVPVD